MILIIRSQYEKTSWHFIFSLASAICLKAELKVASLSTITTEIAKNVGGEAVKVVPIIRAGTDPHDFQPSPSDIRAIEGADLVPLTGKSISQSWKRRSGSRAKFVDVDRSIPSLTMEEEGRMVEDPHWWHSIENMKKAANLVRKHFVEADPAINW